MWKQKKKEDQVSEREKERERDGESRSDKEGWTSRDKEQEGSKYWREMHEKAFWSDEERVGRLAVERGDASKSVCVRGRGKETSASRKSGTSESRGVREYSAAQSNARLQAHETRGLSLSRRPDWKCFVRDHVPAKPPQRNRTIHGSNLYSIHRVQSDIAKEHRAGCTAATIFPPVDFLCHRRFTNILSTLLDAQRVENDDDRNRERSRLGRLRIFRRGRCSVWVVCQLVTWSEHRTGREDRRSLGDDRVEESYANQLDPDVTGASSIGEWGSLRLILCYPEDESRITRRTIRC